jgi:chaperonin GroES
MIVPVAKRVLIQPFHEEKIGGIIITNKKPSRYVVLATGNEVTHVKSGDVIYLEKHYGVEIDHEGEKYLVIDEASILAKIEAFVSHPQ